MANGQDYTRRYREKDKQVDHSSYDYTEMYRKPKPPYRGTVAIGYADSDKTRQDARNSTIRLDSSLSRHNTDSKEWKDAVGLISKSLSSNEQKQVFKEFLELSGVV